ncbi:Uncharacterised protein [Escherichia coli]|uniref:Uncharacterized protein n=1 Tax=Escherichia coli TaxID=562 RepID=A0A377D3M2_ECOLX|nr:Uncharacterised protein [Escherichia coli]
MANRKQQRARAERLPHPAAKSTADLHRLHLSPLSCSQTYYTDLTTVSLPGITRQSFSYLAEIWQNYKASSTSTDKPHPEAIPHPWRRLPHVCYRGSHEER